MEYIAIGFQTALGIILLWLLFRDSILPIHISQWKNSLLRQFGEKK